MNKRIILVGKAGSGKDYFKDYLREQEYDVDTSYTTRPKREGEVEGKTYFYISRGDFERLRDNDFFYESTTFAGNYYGTSKQDWDDKKVCIKTPSGVKQLTDQDRRESVIIYFDIPISVRKKRLSERSDFDKVERRIQADEEDFKGFDLFDIRVTQHLFDEEILEQILELYNLYIK